jgi:transcriptional regulator with XRE-family HTH domain
MPRLPPPAGIGPTLRRLRESQGLTQEQLGEAADVANATISRIERGRLAPSGALLKKLAGGLGVSVDVVLGSKAPTATAKVRPSLARLVAVVRDLDDAAVDDVTRAVKLMLAAGRRSKRALSRSSATPLGRGVTSEESEDDRVLACRSLFVDQCFDRQEQASPQLVAHRTAQVVLPSSKANPEPLNLGGLAKHAVEPPSPALLVSERALGVAQRDHRLLDGRAGNRDHDLVATLLDQLEREAERIAPVGVVLTDDLERGIAGDGVTETFLDLGHPVGDGDGKGVRILKKIGRESLRARRIRRGHARRTSQPRAWSIAPRMTPAREAAIRTRSHRSC